MYADSWDAARALFSARSGESANSVAFRSCYLNGVTALTYGASTAVAIWGNGKDQPGRDAGLNYAAAAPEDIGSVSGREIPKYIEERCVEWLRDPGS